MLLRKDSHRVTSVEDFRVLHRLRDVLERKRKTGEGHSIIVDTGPGLVVHDHARNEAGQCVAVARVDRGTVALEVTNGPRRIVVRRA
jgi:hypothetical protein